MAVPAEELVELEFRNRLRKEGKLVFLAGKQEFIRLGVMDGVDMVLMFHSKRVGPGEKNCSSGPPINGVLAKFIRYRGKESHAGGAPHLGINALNAAMMGLMGIHAQRETFRDEDCIRVHPDHHQGRRPGQCGPGGCAYRNLSSAAKRGGDPGRHIKVNRALRAGAMAIGAEVEFNNLPGYLPSFFDARLESALRRQYDALCWVPIAVGEAGHQTGSTDIGDVSHLMPALHAYVKAGKGKVHTEEFVISDPRLAYVESAKGLALTAIDLLWDGAREGLSIKKNYRAKYTKDEYLKTLTQFSQSAG